MIRSILFCGALFIISSCSIDDSIGSVEAKKNTDSNEVKRDNVKSIEIDYSSFANMSPEELRLSRNEIYARYGRVFTTKDLQDYFSKMDWYKPNPDFKESDISDQDKALIRVIEKWEDAGEMLLKANNDLNGDAKQDQAYIFKSKDETQIYVLVNGESESVQIEWPKSEREEAPDYWLNTPVNIVDIDKNDPYLQFHISQRYFEYVDPGSENYIFDYSTGHLIKSTAGSNSYDAGSMTFNGQGEVMMIESYCPDNKNFYKLEKGKLVLSREERNPEPAEGCAACFTAEMLVSISEDEKTPISWLRNGDEILTYDFSTGKNKMTKIEGIRRIHHDQFIEYHFSHDTIISTLDHPYYLKKKGWASFEPKATNTKYENHQDVAQIETGDIFILKNGKKAKLKSFRIVDARRESYTITKLADGKSFYVNDILVGTELISEPKQEWMSSTSPFNLDQFGFDDFNLDQFGFRDFNFDDFFGGFNFDGFNSFGDSSNSFFFRLDTTFNFNMDSLGNGFQWMSPDGSFQFRMDTTFNFNGEIEQLQFEMDSIMKQMFPDYKKDEENQENKPEHKNEGTKEKKIEGTRRI